MTMFFLISLGQLTKSDPQKLIQAFQQYIDNKALITTGSLPFGEMVWLWMLGKFNMDTFQPSSPQQEAEIPLTPLRKNTVSLENFCEVFNEQCLKKYIEKDYSTEMYQNYKMTFNDFQTCFDAMCVLEPTVQQAITAIHEALPQDIQFIVLSHSNLSHLACHQKNLLNISETMCTFLETGHDPSAFPAQRYVIVSSVWAGVLEHIDILQHLTNHFPQLKAPDITWVSLVNSLNSETHPHYSRLNPASGLNHQSFKDATIIEQHLPAILETAQIRADEINPSYRPKF